MQIFIPLNISSFIFFLTHSGLIILIFFGKNEIGFESDVNQDIYFLA